METGFSLGSNLGDRLAFLRKGRREILAQSGVHLLAQSAVYETEPVGVRPEHQALAFLNVVLVVASERDAAAWLAVIHAIEAAAGRQRGADRYAPRELDIDVLYAGTTACREPNLIVPHPRWAERRFVLQPLADVRPDLILPGGGPAVAARLAVLPPGEAVRLYARDW